MFMNRIWSVVLIVVCAAAAGCAQTSTDTRSRISSSDFVDTAERSPEPAPADPPQFVMSVEEARRGVVDIQASPGAPPEPTDQPTRSGRPILIDAKVGDIHGKPIYVNEFFDLIGDRLEASARDHQPQEWLKEATGIIVNQLHQERKNELAVGEARSSLPPQARQGLFSFIDRYRQDLESQNFGSATRAEQSAQESEGLNTDQLAADQLEQQLIEYELNRNIDAQIHVTKHDERVEWDRNWIRYNPPPTVELIRIYVRATETEAIADIEARLEAGEPFEEIAKSDFNMAPDEGRWQITINHTREHPYTPDMFKETTFIKVERFNEAIRRLELGEWTGPIEESSGRRLAWFRLEGVENLPRSFYDAQQKVRGYLEYMQRADREADYWNKLMRRSDFTDFDDMVYRLQQIAAERYYPEAVEYLPE